MRFKHRQIYRLIYALLAGLMLPNLSSASEAERNPESDTSGWITHWPDSYEKPPSSFVTTLSLGVAYERAGETQTFYLQPEVQKTYATENSGYALGDGELFVGLLKEFNDCVQGQFGVAVAAASNAQLKGNIWEDGDPAFNNYNYSYTVSHIHVALKGKLVGDFSLPVLFYTSLSLGIGSNAAQSFKIVPKIYEEIPAPLFEKNRHTSFTYTLGAGLQRAISEHWQAGVGYEFADWGRNQLDAAEGQTMGTGLGAAHLFTNGLLFSLSYRG